MVFLYEGSGLKGSLQALVEAINPFVDRRHALGDLPDHWRSKLDRLAVLAFPIEGSPHLLEVRDIDGDSSVADVGLHKAPWMRKSEALANTLFEKETFCLRASSGALCRTL